MPMATAVALALYAPALAVGSLLVWRRPVTALYVFVVGLALHNAVMAALYGAGVRGAALTAVQAWKEILLAVALGSVSVGALRSRALPFRPAAVDLVAAAFLVVAAVYALLPQDALGGAADAEGVLLGVRDYLAVVAAYLLGRAVAVGRTELRRLAWTVFGTAAAVAAVGLVEVYLVPIERWRDADVPAYFREELGFEYLGPAGLPENFVFNTGDEADLLRRVVSVFLSPLGAAYTIVVALCLAAAGIFREPRWLATVLAAVAAVGLLFTLTRAALVALAGALCVLALVQRRVQPLVGAGAAVAVGIAFALAFPSIAPETHWFPEDLAIQRARAEQLGVPPGETVSLDEPSIRSHLTSLRDGVETVVRHPQGYGPGNAGAAALRTDVELKAGESTYAEVGVETGVLGLVLFAVWNLLLVVRLLAGGRQDELAAGLGAALAAVLALALQTDVLGVPWLVYCVWGLAGAAVARPLADVATELYPLPRWRSRSIRGPTSATST
jgi:O-Antigen ligase